MFFTTVLRMSPIEQIISSDKLGESKELLFNLYIILEMRLGNLEEK
jgi:hypothetical protein